jgi:Xaa-Pro aminopeptidase
MTRTFVVGKPDAEQADPINEHARLVLTALERAQEAIRPGISGRELFDQTCCSSRRVISRSERRRTKTRSGLSDSRIGEVRFEDLVLVTKHGCETLTHFPYDLESFT